jgi:hypothetical protein
VSCEVVEWGANDVKIEEGDLHANFIGVVDEVVVLVAI